MAQSPPMPRIAVLIPCYNEAVAIPGVIAAFRTALPAAEIYVYDNNSTDGTAQIARDAGARVGVEVLQGKGNVVRRMFADVEADIYILVDGDGTYDAALAEKLCAESLDMVTATRVEQAQAAYRRGHRFGNAVLTGLVSRLFGARVGDMLSGYRVFSRRFVKSFPALAGGFETETELTVHALQLGMPVGEVATPYRERPPGSTSKLRSFRDGAHILRLIVMLVKDERPIPFFSIAAAAMFALGLILGIPVVLEFLRIGLVPRLPTAIVAACFIMLSFLSAACGLILDSVARGRREMKRLLYLANPAPPPSLTTRSPEAASSSAQRSAAPSLASSTPA
jgi:glycosyltransferase involved in cell wall biosynthesis